MERVNSSDEPSVQEVEKLKKTHIIKPNGELTITPSLDSLLKKNIALDIGWIIDGRAESLSGSGSQGFSMGAKNSACRYAIRINESKPD